MVSGTQQEWNGSYENSWNGWGGANRDAKGPFAVSDWSAELPPPRHWEYGRHYIRGSLSCTIADGGTGKTSLAITEAIAMATGRPLLEVAPRGRFRVLYWNGEEPQEEIRRRVHAICQHYHVDPAELKGWLFISSGLQHPINASDERSGLVELRHCVEDNQIEIAILDPFVSCHQTAENDNTALNLVVKRFSALAEEKYISIEIASRP
jgi:RecA-family ATPase